MFSFKFCPCPSSHMGVKDVYSNENTNVFATMCMLWTWQFPGAVISVSRPGMQLNVVFY